MGQVEGNNDSNRNNDIILDGRQLLPTQRHFSSPIITFAACLNFAYFQTNFQITKNNSIKILEDFNVGYHYGFPCNIWTFFFVISNA